MEFIKEMKQLQDEFSKEVEKVSEKIELLVKGSE